MSEWESAGNDPRMRNGWAEYQRLVLAELERHNKILIDLDRSLQDIRVQLALMKEENGKIKTIQQQISGLDQRMGKQETDDSITAGIDKYKKWIIGVIITIIISGIIPLITVILKLKGIG